MVTRQDLLNAVERREPFRIFLKDGRMYVVKEIGQVGVMPTCVKLGRETTPADEASAGTEDVAYDQISRMEPLIQPSPTVTITPQDLDAALHKEPFVPFRIFATDGKSYKVKGFGQIAIGKYYAWLCDEFDQRSDRIYYDRMVRIEPIETSRHSW